MTNNEYKTICGMINNKVTTQQIQGKYGDIYTKSIITGPNISQLKQDIHTLVNNSNNHSNQISKAQSRNIAFSVLTELKKYVSNYFTDDYSLARMFKESIDDFINDRM